ncbi:hypothetical protein V8E54_011241 [Elaphomyces granulatus]
MSYTALVPVDLSHNRHIHRQFDSTGIISPLPGRTPTSTPASSTPATSPSSSNISVSKSSTTPVTPGTSTLSSSSTLTSSSAIAHFIVPMSTSTLQIPFPTPTATSTTTASPFIVTNPSNLQQFVAFSKTTLPPNQRSNLQDGSDLAPLALLFLGFPSPVLLFSSFTMVFPLTDAAWLSVVLYPTPEELDKGDDNTPSTVSKPSSTELSSSFSRSSSSSSSSMTGIVIPVQTEIDTDFTYEILTIVPTASVNTNPPLTWVKISDGRIEAIFGTMSRSPTVTPGSATSTYSNTMSTSSFSPRKTTPSSSFTTSISMPRGSSSSLIPSSSLASSPSSLATSPSLATSLSLATSISLTSSPSSASSPSSSPSLASSPSLTSSPSVAPSSSTVTFHPPQTVTSNGMICVLPYGSNQPVCTPLSTPTPNPHGTNVTVNSGCILINGSPRCRSNIGAISNIYQSFYKITLACFGLTISSKRQLDVASDPSNPYSTTLILSGYDSSDPYSPQQSAKCELQARWPANYGDVYFGADGCLYDSNSNKIFNQCCSTPDINNSGPTVNPYFDPRPAASCQRTPGFGFVHFEIYSKGWITDNGDALHKQAKGCGLMTGWSFGTNTNIQSDGSSADIGRYRPQYLAKFNLPATFKSGCVGRAIASAGGPKGVDC